MEDLAKAQSQTGEIIQRIISNFKKDPQERKTTKNYFEERLQRLEIAWASFEQADTQIRALPTLALDHPYFVKEYYQEILSVYQKYKEMFVQQIKSFEVHVPISADAAPKPLPQQRVEVPKTIKTPQSLQEQRHVQDSELTRLMRRQRGVIESLRRQLSGLITQTGVDQTHQYYEFKLQTIRQLWSQIEGHNYSIWEICDDPLKEGYNTCEYANLEEEVQRCVIQLSTKLDKSSKPPAQHNINSSLKLPKITLTKFDGDYSKWRQFADLFTQMIHNQEMGDCQKMWYLKANVTGEAEKLVRHLSLSNENYTAAWKMLEDRYENKRLLAAALINKLLAQPTQSADVSAAAVRSLHDTTQECLLGLENMGIPIQNWDPLLLHILIKKLDKSTHTLYEQALENPRELQTIKGFLTFLQNRFQSLEALGGKSRQGDEYQKRQHTVRSLTSVASSPLCVSCKGNHPLFGCKSFLKLSPSIRLKLLLRNKLCINCFRPGHYATAGTLRGCTKCLKKHNSLVHLDETNRAESRTLQVPKEGIPTQQSERQTAPKLSNEQPITVATLSNQDYRSLVLLSTARIRLLATNGNSVECRAILDSGSQINIVTDKIIRKLGVKSTSHMMHIHGIGNGKKESRKRASLKMESLVSGFSHRLEVYVLSKIIPPQPTDKVDTSKWSIPNNIKLADPSFNQPGNIDLLIGAEFYHQLLSVGQIKLADGLPILQNTQLGWIVSGRISELPLQEAVCGICSEEENLDKTIERFWQLEELDTATPQFSPAERKCEMHFTQTTRRTESGRFIVSLPFSDDPARLGESKDVALHRFLSLERRLAKDHDLKTQYVEFMKDYRALGHMEEVNIENIVSPYYFVPHHSVLKPDSSSTKLRVVFDASAKTSSNISLNDILYAGPRVQDDLFSILLRFRLPRYVFTADIQKMYRQILLKPNDRKFHLIYWRDDPSQPIKCYQLCTVTYGTTSAPYLATKCLQQLADEGTTKYSLGSQVLRQDFYVDDVMTGSDSIFTATEVQNELISMLKEAGDLIVSLLPLKFKMN